MLGPQKENAIVGRGGRLVGAVVAVIVGTLARQAEGGQRVVDLGVVVPLICLLTPAAKLAARKQPRGLDQFFSLPLALQACR